MYIFQERMDFDHKFVKKKKKVRWLKIEQMRLYGGKK